MSFIKKIVPKKVKIIAKLSKLYAYDFNRFIKNSNVYQTFDTENKLKGKLTIYYHVLEKGLTMPDTRLGFGEPVVLELIDMMNMYLDKKYNLSSLEFVHSMNVLEEYVEFHDKRSFTLKPAITDQVAKLRLRITAYETPKQFEFDRDVYFAHRESSFDKFCLSRYSSRNYSDVVVPEEVLMKCVRLALKSPTSCNRQVNRIYMVRSAEMKQEVLKLQYGNRGFGHLADTLFVITADISVFQGPNDRNESFVNSGMFAMSLLYALHRYDIGACPLNWSVEVHRDLKLRQLLGIPNNERVGLVVSCGYLPEKIKIASSPRLDAEEVVKIL